MRRSTVLFSVAAVLAIVIAPAKSSGAETWVFGDSLSDTGNFYATGNPLWFSPNSPLGRFPTPPFVGGQASNGPVWVQQFTSRLGMGPVTSSETGGTNYAFISALTREFASDNIESPFGVPDMDAQVDTYLAGHTPDPTDLFVIWGGSNDFFFGQTNPQLPVLALSDQITRLASAGATQFVVPNLPLLGQTPSGAASGDGAQLDLLSTTFNDALGAAMSDLRSGLGITIHEIDVEQFFLDVTVAPEAYGFTNVSDPAVSTILDPSELLFGFPEYPAQVVANPDEYLFWDGVHPTASAHFWLGNLAADAVVPEPSTLILWALAVVIAAFYSRQRRHALSS